MFHGVIQKITLAQFFLRHGVDIICTEAYIEHVIQMLRLALCMFLYVVTLQTSVRFANTSVQVLK